MTQTWDLRLGINVSAKACGKMLIYFSQSTLLQRPHEITIISFYFIFLKFVNSINEGFPMKFFKHVMLHLNLRSIVVISNFSID